MGHLQATASGDSGGEGGIDGGGSGGDGGDDSGGADGGDGSDGGDVPLDLSTGMGQSVRVQGAREGSSDARAMRSASVRGSERAPIKAS